MPKTHRESGQTLIFAAITMTVLLGFMAFATDVGVLFHQKRQLQAAADAAAIAAATEALAEGTPTTVTTGIYSAAENDATDNGFTNASNGVTLTVTTGSSNTVPAFQHAGYFQATITQTNPTLFIAAFMGLMGNSGYSGMTVGATAIAADSLTSNGCVYVTGAGGANPAVQEGGSSDLDTEILNPQGCTVYVNGNVNLQGAAEILADDVIASGTITGGQSGWTSDAPPSPIPLSYLSATVNQPTVTTTGTGKSATTTCTAPAGSGLTCYYDYNGGALGSSAKVVGTDTPGNLPTNGIFYFDEASGPSVSGSLTGSGDVIYIAGTSTYLDLDTNSAVNLTPPTSGTLANVIIDAPYIGGTTTCKSGKGNNEGNPGELYFSFGSSSTIFDGIVYAPNAQIFGQDQGASTSIKLDLVVGNICMQAATFDVGGYSQNNPITQVGLVY